MPDVALFAALADAVAAPLDQPRAAFDALRRAANELVGAKLFTVLGFDHDRQVMRRLYSTETRIYPEHAEDPITDTIWERTLIGAPNTSGVVAPKSSALSRTWGRMDIGTSNRTQSSSSHCWR